MTTTNIDFLRLDAAITYIVEHPDEYDFGTYYEKTACGTTCCLAGGIAARDGWAPVWYDGEDNTSDVVKDGVKRYTKHVAAELLGLTEGEASRLFVLSGGLPGIIWVRNTWAREAGLPERTWDIPAGVR